MVARIVEEHRALNALFEKARNLMCGPGGKAFQNLRYALEVCGRSRTFMNRRG